MDRLWIRASVLALTFAAIFAVFFTFVRPWYLQWGASDVEARMTLPGDEIIPNPAGQTTRAVTVDANAESVWPWVAQIGQDRGGFYSFDLLENLVGCRMPTVDILRPDKQGWQLGDKLWMYPPERAGGVGFATLRRYIPGHALAFGTHAVGTSITAPENGSWAYIVQPLDRYTTRLLFRGRGAPRSVAGIAFDRTIFEPVHFVMERRTMIGIKQLAEGEDRHRWANHVQVAMWTITVALVVVSAVQVLRRREWKRPLAGFIVSGLVFEFLTLGQPPVVLGVALLAVVAMTTSGCPGRGNFPHPARSSASTHARAV
jgi:hypothetical protein